jgi:hypothetical protein
MRKIARCKRSRELRAKNRLKVKSTRKKLRISANRVKN